MLSCRIHLSFPIDLMIRVVVEEEIQFMAFSFFYWYWKIPKELFFFMSPPFCFGAFGFSKEMPRWYHGHEQARDTSCALFFCGKW